MKTTAIGIENLCVPCHAFCRYCLLSSTGKATGVDYGRGERLARRLYAEAEKCEAAPKVYYYIGYCMDDLHLPDYIRFCQETHSPSAHFLQLNGLRLRGQEEARALIEKICAAGISTIDLTFYGLREYHDRFAGRTGDFDFLLRLLDEADRQGLKVHISGPIHRENMGQMDSLLDVLDQHGAPERSLFLPHGKGRGQSLSHLRLTLRDLEQLSDRVRACIGSCRTEGEWLADESREDPQTRTLTLSLKPDNIEMLEKMSLQEIILYLEQLDDEYYAFMPTAEELSARYGRRDGDRLYRRYRDLYLEWQQRYLNEFGGEIWDMNDETHHFSVRA